MLKIEAKKPNQTPLQEPDQDIICSKNHPTSSLAQGDNRCCNPFEIRAWFLHVGNGQSDDPFCFNPFEIRAWFLQSIPATRAKH
jgi:hypothetical protein